MVITGSEFTTRGTEVIIYGIDAIAGMTIIAGTICEVISYLRYCKVGIMECTLGYVCDIMAAFA